MIKGLKLAALAALASVLLAPVADAYTTTRKFHPGHYTVLLPAASGQRYMDEAARQTGNVGIMKKYSWRELEPQKGVYDFSKVRADLDWAQAYGQQVIIMIVDKTFKLERPNPGYLDWITPRNSSGGYTMVRWNPTVVARYKALVAAMGQRFDSHPNFEGIAIQESALGFDSATLDRLAYTPEKYRDASISAFGYALNVMPKSRVFWYQNYLVRNQSYIGTIARTLGPKGLVMAGPDVLPDSAALKKMSYPFFDDLQGKAHLGIQIEDVCYRAPHETAGYSTKYWTPAELFRYARDELHVNYLFWVRIAKSTYPDSYDWYDALPVIANNQYFNR
jgi:hypothetical protein